MLCLGRSKRKVKTELSATGMLSDGRPRCTYAGVSSIYLPNSDVCNEMSPLKRLRSAVTGGHSGVLAQRNGCIQNTGAHTRSISRLRAVEEDKENSENDRVRNSLVGRQDETMSASRSRGHLKLAVHVSHEVLTVHVLQARLLSYGSQVKCDSYVQVSLIPDSTESRHYRTDVVYGSNHPRFDDKFTIELDKSDQKRRLLISLWHNSTKTGRPESLGCMSFSIRRLLAASETTSTGISGWYSLLCEKLGQRKHVRVHQTTDSHKGDSRHIPKVNTNLLGLDSHTICIRRGPAGFGFTVSGSCPVRVATLAEGGPAQLAGLRQGDFIAELMGRNVSRSSCYSVAKIVRQSEGELTICVHRYNNNNSSNNDNRSMARSTSISNFHHNSATSIPDHMNGPASSSMAGSNPEISQQKTSHRTVPGASTKGSVEELMKANNLCTSQPSCSSAEQMRWDPDMSPIPQMDATSRFIESVNLDESFICTRMTTESSVKSLRRNAAFCDLWERTRSARDHDSAIMIPWPPDCSLATDGDVSLQINPEEAYDREDVASIDEDLCNSALDISYTLDDVPERHLVDAVHEVVRCEQEFVCYMQRGMQGYSRPLRHRIISAEQHAALFQNIEKLVMISQYHISQLTASYCQAETTVAANTTLTCTSTNNIGAIYKPKLDMLCSAYASYDSGMSRALDVLTYLLDSTRFCEFVKNASLKADLTSLEEFLLQPAQHLEDLLGSLQQVLACMSSEDEGHDQLARVITEIHSTCSRAVTFESTRTDAEIPSFRSRRESLPRNVSYADMSRSSESVDSEIVQLQNRMTFAKGVEPCQIAAGFRHLIFSGELLWQDSAICRPLCVLLLSDLLLLTINDSQGGHLVVESPMYLRDIVDMRFNCEHPSEFELTALREGVRCTYRLQALDIEQKCAWKTILEHRMKACRT